MLWTDEMSACLVLPELAACKYINKNLTVNKYKKANNTEISKNNKSFKF